MSTSRDWREILGNVIADSSERERIASEIGVHSITLLRWANGESTPRSHNLRCLLRVLPQSQYAGGAATTHSEKVEQLAAIIPSHFILEVLETRATTADLLRYWHITRLVLQQALNHLDPEHCGVEITLVRCMPPGPDGKILSLRESIGLGTSPWSGGLEEKALLLGAESLAGHVTSSGHLEQVGDLRANKSFLSAYQAENEVSAAACPLMYGGRVAGCLLFVSTRPDYFALEAKIALMKGYTYLLSLAFEPEEFYESDQFSLRIMPSLQVQHTHFIGFRQRVLSLMQASSYTGSFLASTEAEKMVWRELETAMLNQPFV